MKRQSHSKGCFHCGIDIGWNIHGHLAKQLPLLFFILHFLLLLFVAVAPGRRREHFEWVERSAPLHLTNEKGMKRKSFPRASYTTCFAMRHSKGICCWRLADIRSQLVDAEQDDVRKSVCCNIYLIFEPIVKWNICSMQGQIDKENRGEVANIRSINRVVRFTFWLRYHSSLIPFCFFWDSGKGVFWTSEGQWKQKKIDRKRGTGVRIDGVYLVICRFRKANVFYSDWIFLVLVRHVFINCLGRRTNRGTISRRIRVTKGLSHLCTAPACILGDKCVFDHEWFIYITVSFPSRSFLTVYNMFCLPHSDGELVRFHLGRNIPIKV